jgi:predicted ATPase/DNA-binding winged helix-turn-helix (wHTH) protein
VASRDPGVREQALAFGPYLLLRSQKMLLENGRGVRLGNRALDLLIALAERAGEVVSKNELINYAWPDTFVEDSNLRVHVAALRKILGDGDEKGRYIINVAGRGYTFVAPVSFVDPPAGTVKSEPTSQDILPSLLTRVVGREQIIGDVSRQVALSRLVTIVGPGGVGKTTVSLAVAERLAETMRPRICFVDLSAIQDPSQVPSALATVVGISALTHDPIPSLIACLVDIRILFVLDNCEHVIANVTELVERILAATQMVRFLATSREPLLAQGEQVCNLPPLATPPDSSALPARRALKYPAVQLFVERAISSLDTFALTDSNALDVAAICRRLDGIPLAIELVAARVGRFGVDTLARKFGDELILTAKGRRTAGPRHQSLRATLDWSYDLLVPLEQALLRRLAVFRGAFSSEAAIAVAARDTDLDTDILDGLMSLVAKSLLITDVSGPTIRYRLLHVTRAYGTEKLEETGERNDSLRLHAEHIRRVLEGAIIEWEKVTRPDWLLRYGNLIDDVRAALDWAFAAGGNIELGAALTVASLPYGTQLSLIDEFKQRAQLALTHVAHVLPPQPMWELRLVNAYVTILVRTAAPDEAVRGAMNRAVALAKITGVASHMIEPFTVQAIYDIELGDYPAATEVMGRFETFAKSSDDVVSILFADRVGAQVYIITGDLARARLLSERVLRHPIRSVPLIYAQAPIDRQVSMRATLALALWLQGFPSQANALVAEGIQLAEADGPASICQILALSACTIAFWEGNLNSARRFTENLIDYARRHTLNRWLKLGLCYQSTLDFMLQSSKQGMAEPLDVQPGGPFQRHILATIHDRWIDPPTIDLAAKELCGFATAEVLRLHGERLVAEGAKGAALAEASFRSAIRVAQYQGSLAWELRATTSLARLLGSQGRSEKGAEELQAVLRRYTEGFETADVVKAKSLLEAVQSARPLNLTRVWDKE